MNPYLIIMVLGGLAVACNLVALFFLLRALREVNARIKARERQTPAGVNPSRGEQP